MLVKFVGGVVGLVGVFWLAIAGGYAVWWWDREPVRPAWAEAHFLWWHLPEAIAAPSLAAQLAAVKAEEAAAATRAKTVETAQAQASVQIGTKDKAAQIQIRTVTKTLIKEVAYAVPAAVDADLPSGWVRLHDDAARDLVPALSEPSADTDAAPSGIKLSAALTTVVSNYGQCHADQARLADLQAWVRAMQSAAAPTQ